MKALVLEAYNKFVYKDMPDPQMEPDEVLLQVQACGICGSDVHGMDGLSGRRQPPIIMGHEASGTILETGTEVSSYANGDRVTFDSTVYCGACSFCRRGHINLCDNRRVLGVSCDEYRRHGAFAELVAVPGHILFPLPENLTFDQAAMVEPLSVAVHAVERTDLRINDTAVVVGAGMIGLLIVQVLRAAGCGHIITVDLDQKRLDLSLQLGADQGIKSDSDDVFKEIFECTQGRGADIAFEVVGITTTVDTAVKCLRKGGSLTLVGNLSPQVEWLLQAVVTREITVKGSCASNGEYPACLDMMARGTVNVDALISARAPLSDGADWFDRLYDNREGLMKVILNP